MKDINKFVRLVEAKDSEADLVSLLRHDKKMFEDMLRESPAILFRGFKGFSLVEVCRVFSEPLDYTYRSTPRTQVSKGMYTATEYPSESVIVQHCENAYTNAWPLKIFFHCETAAAFGGETPIGDVRKVTEDIPKEIREIFKSLKVLYVRNYTPGLDISWQNVFQTNDKQELERYCQNNDISFEWRKDGSLKTYQVCQGMAAHPITREELWYNQAHLFHISNLEPDIRSYLLEEYTEAHLPRNAYYGNGDPIEDDVLDLVRNAFSKHQYTFKWKSNDLLLLDNMLCSHGRNPFKGNRKVHVAMCDLVKT